jgi:hypothetical protein
MTPPPGVLADPEEPVAALVVRAVPAARVRPAAAWAVLAESVAWAE